MKKLMFAVAAMAAGVAMAAGEITSQNVVGYANNGLREGAKMVGSQFLGIGTEGGAIELQTLKCRPEDSDYVFLSTLDSMGGMIKTYAWVNYGGEGDEECWLDTDTMEKPTTAVYFQPGDALWVEGNTTDNTVTSSGEVGTADVTVTLREGATMVANSTPVQVELQDITCRNEDSDEVFLSTLDSMGGMIKTYAWVNYGGEGDEECWLDTDTMEKPTTAVYFQPGEGLWVEGNSTDNQITIPGVEL